VSEERERYVSTAELRGLRQSLGLTQEEAAGICGVDLRTYQRWELGETKARSVYVDRLRARTTRTLARILDTRSPVEDALRLLQAHVGGSSAALFMAEESSPRVALVYGVGIDDGVLDRVNGAWAQEREALVGGQPFWRGSWCAWPLPVEQGQLLVYVAGPRALALPVVQEALGALSGSFRAAVAGAAPGGPSADDDVINAYLKREPLKSIERRQLETLLEQHEWNLSRVARFLRISRITMYERMKRFGIERLHVRKTSPRGKPS
jgi:transcriptional regulator with XRE-family HTH domain